MNYLFTVVKIQRENKEYASLQTEINLLFYILTISLRDTMQSVGLLFFSFSSSHSKRNDRFRIDFHSHVHRLWDLNEIFDVRTVVTIQTKKIDIFVVIAYKECHSFFDKEEKYHSACFGHQMLGSNSTKFYFVLYLFSAAHGTTIHMYEQDVRLHSKTNKNKIRIDK